MNYKFIGNTDLNIHKATLEEALSYCASKTKLVLDIETSYKFGGKYKDKDEGLDPHLSSICMFQIGDKDCQFIVDARQIDCSVFKPILENLNIQIIGHNIKFEYKHILHNYGIRINNMYDTQLVEQINHLGPRYKNLKFSLEALVKKYLNKTVNKETRLEFSKIGNAPFSLKQIMYGAEDILHPYLIQEFQLPMIQQKGTLGCVRLENKFVAVLGDIELKGMHFNQDIWLKTFKENQILYKNQKTVLDNFVIKYYFDTKFVSKQLDLFNQDFNCNIQWSSPKQVVEFFKELNICPQEISKTTKKLVYTVNAKVVKASLNTINKDIEIELKEFIKEYLIFKEYEQAVTTFGEEFLKNINPVTKRLHSNYKQIINTGRISSSGPNLQNIPAKLGFRSAFDCAQGWNIVNADYSGQEQIILANKSKDKDLIYFYEQNLGDMHSYIASKIFPEISHLSLNDVKQFHSDKRQIAKSAGFAINYGGNGFTIAKNLGIPGAQGDAVYDAYFKAFPGLKNYFESVQKEAIRRGYILIDPITGRKNWFFTPKTPKEKSKIERAALNYPNIGTPYSDIRINIA